jgi:hypothetical protein
MNKARYIALTTLLLLLTTPPAAFARVKLITLPVRQRVEIQLDSPQATLVEEERVVPLVQGENQVDFSWNATQIDPGTIVFRVLGPADDQNLTANVLSVSYPPGENALIWQVSSSASGSVRVRISYVLGNLTKSFNYRAVAEHDESMLTLSQYVRVANFAGEEYSDSNIYAGFGDKFTRPVGLNETKEMLVDQFDQVPIRKTYTCNPSLYDYLDRPQNKLRVPMHYVLANKPFRENAPTLGHEPLPYGKVRIFQKDSQGTTAFLGEDWGQFTPIDDEMKLYLGVAQDIVVRRTIEKNTRQRVAGNLYHYNVVVKYEIENFKDQPVTLDIAEEIPHIRQEIGRDPGFPAEWVLGDETTLAAGPDVKDSTQHHLLFHADLPARQGDKAEKIIHRLNLVFRNEW